MRWRIRNNDAMTMTWATKLQRAVATASLVDIGVCPWTRARTRIWVRPGGEPACVAGVVPLQRSRDRATALSRFVARARARCGRAGAGADRRASCAGQRSAQARTLPLGGCVPVASDNRGGVGSLSAQSSGDIGTRRQVTSARSIRPLRRPLRSGELARQSARPCCTGDAGAFFVVARFAFRCFRLGPGQEFLSLQPSGEAISRGLAAGGSHHAPFAGRGIAP